MQQLLDFLLSLLGLKSNTPEASPSETAQDPSNPIPSGYQMSDAGIALIKSFEGLKLQAYPDPATGGAPWTIGFGHTGPEVAPGLIWTEDQADSALRSDLSKFVADVNSMLINRGLSDNAFSALVSFAYNAGPHNLESSTLLKLVNQGDLNGAAEQFQRWDRAAGKEVQGLLRRRLAERDLFLS